MSQPSAQARPPGRQAQRREQTRARLVAAARTLLARQGADATRINEITTEADLGFGSFYNHFSSKEAIVEAVLQETVAAHGAAVEAVTGLLEDPAEVVAAAHRYFVRMARTDPDLGWLLIRLESSHNVMLAALAPYAERDLDRGIAAGRFRVADRRVALYGTAGALLAVMRAVLDGRAPPGADSAHAEGILGMLGVPAEEAIEIARRPMPAVRSEPARLRRGPGVR